mmetsp:Transcript_12832/g.36961  ORF Transcript_12832/g.36961 Transcript_12832/m.36961 type:complete len:347 (-) Transcript_12832:310-1350(-)
MVDAIADAHEWLAVLEARCKAQEIALLERSLREAKAQYESGLEESARELEDTIGHLRVQLATLDDAIGAQRRELRGCDEALQRLVPDSKASRRVTFSPQLEEVESIVGRVDAAGGDRTKCSGEERCAKDLGAISEVKRSSESEAAEEEAEDCEETIALLAATAVAELRRLRSRWSSLGVLAAPRPLRAAQDRTLRAASPPKESNAPRARPRADEGGAFPRVLLSSRCSRKPSPSKWDQPPQRLGAGWAGIQGTRAAPAVPVTLAAPVDFARSSPTRCRGMEAPFGKKALGPSGAVRRGVASLLQPHGKLRAPAAPPGEVAPPDGWLRSAPPGAMGGESRPRAADVE